MLRTKTYLLISLFPLSAFAAVPANVQELYNNVEVGWPSPTPHLKERFHYFLAEMPQNAVVAEVGVQQGVFAEYIYRKTNPKHLYLIDCWEQQDPQVFDDPEANVDNNEQEKYFQETKRRFKHAHNVTFIKKYSIDAVQQFEDESLDWVYIDANHAYEAIKEDLALWWPKVKHGGIISGHDYINFKRQSFGVTQAVNEFLRDNNLYFMLLTTEDVYNSWAIRKP